MPRDEYPPGMARAFDAAIRREVEESIDGRVATWAAVRAGKPLKILPAKNAAAPPFSSIARGRTPASPYRSALEQSYAELLEARRLAGEVVAWLYEGLTLNLGGGAKYRPDFMVVGADLGLTLAECKGFWREAARVRIKVAAAKFPWLQFVAVTRGKDGTWCEEFFDPRV